VIQKEICSQLTAAYALETPETSHQFQVGDCSYTEPRHSSLAGKTIPGATDHPDSCQFSALTSRVLAVGAESWDLEGNSVMFVLGSIKIGVG